MEQKTDAAQTRIFREEDNLKRYTKILLKLRFFGDTIGFAISRKTFPRKFPFHRSSHRKFPFFFCFCFFFFIFGQIESPLGLISTALHSLASSQSSYQPAEEKQLF